MGENCNCVQLMISPRAWLSPYRALCVGYYIREDDRAQGTDQEPGDSVPWSSFCESSQSPAIMPVCTERRPAA
jgi:hypothetical protein